LFERVSDGTISVVGNVHNSRDRIANGLGIFRGDLHATCLAALRDPVAPVIVDQPSLSGPVAMIV
jgi:3-polyprenyl-4-hydroxybenzoate decarboxylase